MRPAGAPFVRVGLVLVAMLALSDGRAAAPGPGAAPDRTETATSGAAGDEGPNPLVAAGPLSFAPLARRVVPAVVNIAVTESIAPDSEADGTNSGGKTPGADIPPALRGTPFEKQFREKQRSRREQVLGAGSGFIIDPTGVIVTNNHVVGNADKIVVSLADGTQLAARVLGADELTDIAVIKVDAGKALAFVPWGDSRRIAVGDWILAAGNPFGLGSSVTAGIVSARGRDIGAGPFDDFLQLDAPINPGNSGGPSFNMSGQVVALNTAIVSPTGGSVGIGFGIPSEIVAPIVDQLRAKGHIDRGWLGVSVRDGGGPDEGVVIASVDRAGPAARAGLRSGDQVVSVNGDHVDNARGLIRTVARAAPGSSVNLAVLRRGKPARFPILVGRRPEGSGDESGGAPELGN